MKILFVSGDVGGARALLPVIKECEMRNIPFVVFKNGHILEECEIGWELVFCPLNEGDDKIEFFLKELKISCLAFASSIKDTTALTLARNAKSLEIPTVHLLDNWTNYHHRMEIDGLPAFKPDFYAVMDSLARDEAKREGINEKSLFVVGQPALAELSQRYKSLSDECNRSTQRSGKRVIVFISEPVQKDQGTSDDSPNFRGYTEKTVLCDFARLLQPYAEKIDICLLPHPREDDDELQKNWVKTKGALQGRVLKNAKMRDIILTADGIAGMASILLYEAWLLGKPVVSLQPNVRNVALRQLEKRDGVFFVDSPGSASRLVDEWIAEAFSKKDALPRPELFEHERASERILTCIQKASEIRRSTELGAAKWMEAWS